MLTSDTVDAVGDEKPRAADAGLSPRLVRQLAGRCCYGACQSDALAGLDYCAPHDAHEKGRARKKQQRRRQRRANAGRCSAGCGRRVGKRRRADKTIQPRECAECSRRHRKRSAKARERVRPPASACVPDVGEISPSTKLEVGKDGATRTRQVFRIGQSGKSKEEIRRGHLRMVEDAERLIVVWRTHYNAETDALIAEMPRIQREEARSRRADPLAQALRQLLLVAEETDPRRADACAACGHAHEDDE